MTTPSRVSRILTAAAVLVDNTTTGDDGAINSAILGRAAYLIQGMWQTTFPTLTRRCDITDFWRRVKAQVLRGEDMVDFLTVTDETVNPPGYAYGQNVRLEFKTERGPTYHAITITAKKD